METEHKQRTGWLVGVAALALVSLMVLPTTGWLARLQTKTLVTRSPEVPSLLRDLGVKEAPGIDLTAQSPKADTGGTDYAAELGRAVVYPTANQDFDAQLNRLKRIRAVGDRFPEHRKQAISHSLRYFTSGLVRPHRDGEVETYMTGKPFTSQGAPDPRLPEALATFDRIANDGEIADPDNAYFPLMRSIGLFEAHRDTEGLAAVKRAASKSRFDDYAFDEPEAALQRSERAYGHPTAMVRQSIFSATLFPHYASLRGVARLTAYLATKTEAAGHPAEGLAIRSDMMRCAALMRSESHSAIGSLVGIAMFLIQSNRVGGSSFYTGMSEEAWKALSESEKSKRRIELFVTYATANHREDLANRVQTEYAASVTSKEIIKRGTDYGAINGFNTRLFNRWAVSMIVLTNLLTLLALCGGMLLLRTVKRETGLIPLMVGITICCLATLLASRSEWLPAMAALQNVIANLNGSDSTALSLDLQQGMAALLSAPILGRLIVVTGSVALPWILTIALAINGRKRGQDETSSLVTGLGRSGGALCLTFTLLYATALGFTLREENRQANGIDQATHHEGRYFAQQLHTSWPPLTRF